MFTKDGYHKALTSKTGDDAYILLGNGGHKKLTELLVSASLGASGNSTTLSITVAGTTKTGSVTVPYATKAGQWYTARAFKIGDTSKNIDGTGNVTWTLNEIGVYSKSTSDGRYVYKAGDTMVDTISASADAYSGGGFHNGYANLILRGNSSTGVSAIVFSSSKGNTTINRPSDCGFIQFHPYGITTLSSIGSNPTLATSGESNRLVIGVNNDSGDQVWLQTPGHADLRHIVGGTNNYQIWDSGNTYVSGNKGYIGGAEITQVNNASYATTAGSANSVTWGNVTSKPPSTGSSTQPVYWNGSTFIACTAYGSASVNYANSAGNADKLDNEHKYQIKSLLHGSDMIYNMFPLLDENISIAGATVVTAPDNNAPYGKVWLSTSYNAYWGDWMYFMPGETIFIESWVMRQSGASGTAGTYYVGIDFRDKTDKPINGNSGCNYMNASGWTCPCDGVWYHKTCTYTIPKSHTVYNGSDGGAFVRGKIRILLNYSSGTIPTYFGGVRIRRSYVSGNKGYIYGGEITQVNNATNAGNADTVDNQHFTWSNSSNSPTYLWGTNSNGSNFLAARGSITVGYATYPNNVLVYQHTGNNTDYPLIWSNQTNSSDTWAQQLYKSYSDLVYNPANKRISTKRFQSSLTTSSHIAGLNGTNVPFNSTAGAGYNMVLRVLGTGGAYNLGVYSNSFVVVYGAQSLIDAGTNSYTHSVQLMNLNGLSMFKNLVVDGANHINESTSASYRLYVKGQTYLNADGNGALLVTGTSSNYREGIRISSCGGWADIMLCGSDATHASGTSANSWFIGNNNGNFYITRNGSSSGTAYMSCVSNKWYFNTGTGSEIVNVGGWIATVGKNGWYNSTYGGGIWMNDSTYVRIYNGKYLYTTYQYYDVGNQDYTIDHVYASNDKYIRPMAFSTFTTKLLSQFGITTDTRRSKNSSNADIESVTGYVLKNKSFIDIWGFAPTATYRTTKDRPAPYGIGFTDGSDSGGIMPVGDGNALKEIRFYGANSGPTHFTFGRMNWESTSYDSDNSNSFSLYTDINGTNGDIWTSGSVAIGTSSFSDKLRVYGGIMRIDANSAYVRIGPQNSSHCHYETNAGTSHWFNKRIDVNGNIWVYGTNYGIASNGNFYAYAVYANRPGNSTAGGISLYGTEFTYGIMFRGTSWGGTHGGVTGDWATYLTMSNTTNRGWIFRRGSTNVASIDGNGKLYLGYPNSSANPGVYWNPYVESASDGSDVSAIYQIKSGVAGGTELRISQANDSGDVINICSPYYIYFNSKRAFGIYDGWLRINENVGFSSGIYTGSSLIRTDNQLQVGSGGSAFYANSSGNGYFSNTLGIAGTNTGYKLYVNGTSYLNGNTLGTRIWLNHNSNLSPSYSWTGAALTVPTIEVQNYTGTVDNRFPTITLHHYGYGGPRISSRQGIMYIYGGNTDARTLGSKNSYFSSLKIYPNEFDGFYVNDIKTLLAYRRTNNSVTNQPNLGMFPPAILELLSAGYPVYTDPEFASGNNSIGIYNNQGNGTVTITRQADDQGSGNSSGYILKIVTNGKASPGAGGVICSITSRANAIFVQVFRAKIPIGWSIYNAENSQGSNASITWLTQQDGTGKWEWYARLVYCGNTGSFSGGGHLYLSGTSNTSVTWYLSHMTLVDITKGNYNGLRTRYSDYSTSAGNADTVDNQHFSYSNSSNTPTWIWGSNSSGTNFLASRTSLTVGYATYPNNVLVYQHTANNTDYPLIWSNQTNSSNNWAQQLHKSYSDLVYNPANKIIKTWAYKTVGESTNRGINFNDSGAWINSIGTSVIFRNAIIRFGGSGWDWDVWAGLSYDSSNKRINIGIPDSSIFTANSAKTNGTIRTVNSKIEIFPNGNSNYGEGLRIHTASNGWTTLMLCGSDNTAFNGTSTNSWSMHTNGGNFYLNKATSSTAQAPRLWGRSNGTGWTIGNLGWDSYQLEVAGVTRLQDSLVIGGYATYGTHYVTGAGGRLYFGGNFHIDSIGRAATYDLYLNYYAKRTIHFQEDRILMDNEGKIYVGNTGVRRAGMYGTYDSYKIGHIWSMGTAYVIANDGSNFGNLYGLAYKHTNNGTGGTMAGGHQAVWCNNGSPRAAMGYNGFWAAGGFYKNGSSDSYVLLGGGGHKLESNLSVNYANSAGSATNATVNDSTTDNNYRMVWHYGNTLYSTAGIYCNPGKLSFGVGNNVTLSGKYAQAYGNGSVASAENSHAEGFVTTASGFASHSQNYSTTASGYASHAEGFGTTASGRYSHASGYMNSATNDFEAAFGCWNVSNTNTIFSIGGGGIGARSNLFEITKDGNTYINNNLKVTGYGTFGQGAYMFNGYDLILRAASGSSDSGDIVFQNGSSTEIGRIWHDSGNFLVRFSSSDSPKVLIHSGNISNYVSGGGSGNYLPLTGGRLSGDLDVDNSEIWINGSSPRLVFHYPNNNWANISMSGGAIYFNAANNSNSRCNIYAGNAYAAAFYTTSDATKKKNITQFSDHIYKFTYKESNKDAYGVIAQNVEEMFRDGDEGNMKVNYDSVLSYYVGLLENEIKNLKEENSNLKTRIEDLYKLISNDYIK